MVCISILRDGSRIRKKALLWSSGTFYARLLVKPGRLARTEAGDQNLSPILTTHRFFGWQSSVSTNIAMMLPSVCATQSRRATHSQRRYGKRLERLARSVTVDRIDFHGNDAPRAQLFMDGGHGV